MPAWVAAPDGVSTAILVSRVDGLIAGRCPVDTSHCGGCSGLPWGSSYLVPRMICLVSNGIRVGCGGVRIDVDDAPVARETGVVSAARMMLDDSVAESVNRQTGKRRRRLTAASRPRTCRPAGVGSAPELVFCTRAGFDTRCCARSVCPWPVAPRARLWGEISWIALDCVAHPPACSSLPVCDPVSLGRRQVPPAGCEGVEKRCASTLRHGTPRR
ncbi:hypothetical protein DAEQUDRAFT_528079 [Daedalea quercina L-15889]|uniref:Uncharacterized protein n=1 Tax=Daedalea quercina L-15889 TaxID=1314783 RepID=A0A165MA37_9APHY|nr:hypothetical protein DAEQUDRAFT_528079 [Daedalea quercina L-15889]